MPSPKKAVVSPRPHHGTRTPCPGWTRVRVMRNPPYHSLGSYSPRWWILIRGKYFADLCHAPLLSRTEGLAFPMSCERPRSTFSATLVASDHGQLHASSRWSETAASVALTHDRITWDSAAV